MFFHYNIKRKRIKQIEIDNKFYDTLIFPLKIFQNKNRNSILMYFD